jgi:hypothetical protein
MKIIFKTMIWTLVCLSLCAAYSSAKSQVPPASTKTQIVIIGTLHEFHYNNPKYPPEVLKEIILALKPDAILNELPLSKVDPNGRPLNHNYLASPECWAADMVATQLGVKQIPFDRPDREENFKKTNYFERQKKSNEQARKWLGELQENDPNSLDLKIVQIGIDASQAQADLFDAAPEFINCNAFDLLIKIKHSVWENILHDLIEKYSDYKTLASEACFLTEQWHIRNRIMADNIIKAAKQYPRKRLVVITGAEHRYILRDLLKDESGIDLKEYWEVIDFDLDKCLKSLPPPPISETGIFVDGLTKEQASQKVVKQYWQAIIDKDWELVNKLRPPVVGVNWQEMYTQNMPVELLEVKETFWPEGQSLGPLVPCVVKFADGKIFEINMIPQFRTIRGKTICFITGTWGKRREITDYDGIVSEPNQPAYLKTIPPDKLKEDLDFLFKTIEEVHPNLYAYSNREEYALVKNELYKQIDHAMSISEFYVYVQPVVYYLKDDHTRIFRPPNFIRPKITESMRKFGKRLKQLVKDVNDANTNARYIPAPRKKEYTGSYSHHFFPGYDTCLMVINWFGMPDQVKQYAKKFQKTFNAIREKGITNLVIDVRENRGGCGLAGDELLKYLADKPFRQIEKIEQRLVPELSI